MNRITAWFQTRPTTKPEDERLFWRERILAIILIGAATLGLVAYLTNLVTSIQAREWGWLIIYSLAFAWVLSLAIFRQIGYTIRAASLLIILLLLGIVAGLQYGSAGDARLWLIGFTILSSVFLGLRAGIGASLVSTSIYLLLGWLMSRGILAAPPPDTDLLQVTNFATWSTTGITYLVVSLLIVFSVGILINGLNNGLQHNQQLTHELEEDRARLASRTRNLERRELQVRTAAEISRTIGAELDPDAILQRVVNLLQERFGLYYVGAFVLDAERRYAILRAGTGEAGQAMQAANHRLAVGGTSMIGWATARQQARIALDVGADAVHFDNPHLPETRSELALPMMAAGKTLGALTVQSTEPEAFDQDDITVFQGVADSLAIALRNASLFQQVQANLDEIRTLHRQYLAEAWADTLRKAGDLSFSYQAADSSPDQPESGPDHVLEVPLTLRDQVIGLLTLESDQATWTPEQQAFINAVTSQAAVALENIRLIETTRRQAGIEQSLSDFSANISQTLDIDSVLKAAVREIGKLPNVQEVAIQIGPSKKEAS
ncbi:MAG: GAF domain-containing protein [Anaerolineales bacterium]|nr:GAF domain-containing protein [Anaerolineales bacterium]